MSGAKEALREEVAALAGTIRELREELAAVRAQSAQHHCHGCGCTHVIWNQPYTPSYTWPGITWTSQPYQVTCGDTAGMASSTATIPGGQQVSTMTAGLTAGLHDHLASINVSMASAAGGLITNLSN